MKRYIPYLFVIICFLYLLVIMLPALEGKLTGTFQKHSIPRDYTKLSKFLTSDTSFGRTLWIPSVQRFGFYSTVHPAVYGSDFFHVASPSGQINLLQSSERILQETSIAYVIVPNDSEGELFLTDRKYDVSQYQKTIISLQGISWLSEIQGFSNMHVFALSNVKNHIWLMSKTGNVLFTFINPTKYQITFTHVKKGDRVLFSEAYSPYWKLQISQHILSSTQYNSLINSFILPVDGSYTAFLTYDPQTYVGIGSVVSLVSLITFTCIFMVLLLRKVAHTK